MFQNKKHQNAFTVIELMFAMTFLSVLLIIALMSSLSIMRTYSKGLTLKQVDQSGRAIGSEVQRAMNSAQPPIEETPERGVDKGRLCLGSYSFVWSIGGEEPLEYSTGERVGFAKVSDSSGEMCLNSTATIPKDRSVELLAAQNIATIAVQKAELTQAPSYDGQYLYTFTFTIGTDDASLLTDERDACRADTDQQYCALNRFRITASPKGL